MSIKLLIDMNLSPRWTGMLRSHGWESVHWSEIGDPGAPDREIMDWARTHGYSVFTHDLDFGAILAVTQAEKPSVVQIRTQEVLPESLENRMIEVLSQHESLLEEGVLIVVDENASRVRILPLDR